LPKANGKEMVTMKKILGGIAIGLALATTIIGEPQRKVRVINANDLTAEILESRNGDIIIERVIGIVTDAENGNGCELNGNYISYKSVSEIKNGDVICTYLVYNPNTNCIDDIAARYDYVME
jgi:hypothetical protein